jgi:hypothetical protein
MLVELYFRLSRDTDTKNMYKISMWGDALDFQYEPLPYLKFLIVLLKATIFEKLPFMKIKIFLFPPL